MIGMEVHPGDGGADAIAFAEQLATALSKHSGRTAVTGTGTTVTFHRL
jgi:protein subunit release factor A